MGCQVICFGSFTDIFGFWNPKLRETTRELPPVSLQKFHRSLKEKSAGNFDEINHNKNSRHPGVSLFDQPGVFSPQLNHKTHDCSFSHLKGNDPSKDTLIFFTDFFLGGRVMILFELPGCFVVCRIYFLQCSFGIGQFPHRLKRWLEHWSFHPWLFKLFYIGNEIIAGYLYRIPFPLSMVVSGSLVGGRWCIITQLAVYSTYIPLIYCLLGDYIFP